MDITVIIMILFALILFYAWFVYNGLITAKVRIKESLSHIDVQLKRRTDLIPNLVSTVKGYAKHEKDLLEKVTQERSQMMSAKTTQEKAQANNMLSDTLKSLFAVTENYPELKANQNFLKLQEELTDTENKIAYSRQFYNTNVLDYNTKLQIFPSNLYAKLFHFSEAEFFNTDDKEKAPVKINF